MDDEGFAHKAQSAFDKIQAVLPAALQGELQQITTYATPIEISLPWSVCFSELRECIRKRQKIKITYRDEKARTSTRTLRPVALIFASPVWMLAAWCETRNDFRHFRLDRIVSMSVCTDGFEEESDKNISAYLKYEKACRAEFSE